MEMAPVRNTGSLPACYAVGKKVFDVYEKSQQRSEGRANWFLTPAAPPIVSVRQAASTMKVRETWNVPLFSSPMKCGLFSKVVKLNYGAL
jgi:hypothetical protein